MHTSDWINDIITSANTHISRPAMVIEEKTYTYGQLLGQAWDICTTLCTQQADVIGIVAENCMETYASILAVLFSGKTYVILHSDYPAERNRLIARQADIRLLLYSKKKGRVAAGCRDGQFLYEFPIIHRTAPGSPSASGIGRTGLHHLHIGQHWRAQRSPHLTG